MPVPKCKDKNETCSNSLLSDIDAEIALEISSRKRLVDTLEGRIAWATALKEILHRQVGGNATYETVRDLALDTLRVIESPSDFLLCHDPPPPFPPKFIRLPPRRLLPPLNTSSTKPKPSFLFIRSSTFDLPLQGKTNSNDGREETTVYLLKCPTCSKTSFNALQGLLNHARLVHSLEWGTHEECISACAVPDNKLDLTCGTEVGLGPTGILPGLRNIFQMAVCGRNTRAERGLTPEDARDDTLSTKTPLSTLTNALNQSLGLHDESPALAPFLGKDPVRRQIKVTEEDVDVDIEGINQDGPSSGRWRMPFAHRHCNISSLPFPETQNTEEKSNAEASEVEKSTTLQVPFTSEPTSVLANSRFHLVSRIIITDRSLWIPPEERIPEHSQYTHKWMISIDSPSYTHHITSILNSVQVTPVDPTVDIPIPPSTTGPPFVVLGVANKGFHAKITLSFSGLLSQAGLSLSEQTFLFEHWVDLYPIKESHIIKGQDQIVDIELDKDTIIKARRRDYIPTESRSLWNRPFAAGASSPPNSDQLDQRPMEEYEKRLGEVVNRFPMTIEDFKGKRSKLPKIPYMLANSVEHLSSFVTGRRKAIEWCRARAIHEAYTWSLGESSHLELPALTEADVYSWLSENGHFPRLNYKPIPSASQPPAKVLKDNRTEDAKPIWCRFCGLDTRLHGSDNNLFKKEGDGEDKVSTKEDVDEKAKVTITECPIVTPTLQITKLPRIDIKGFVFPDQAVSRGVGITFDRRTLLAAADPSMIQFIHKLTKFWKLDTFHATSKPTEPAVMFLNTFGKNRQEVETHLASHALLSLLTKQFISALVNRGLDVSDRNKAKALSTIPFRRRTAARNQVTDSIRMLTPTHVLSGILTRGLGREAKRHPVDAYLLLALARLGVAVDGG